MLEMPLYPIMYHYLVNKLSTAHGREELYLKSGYFFPLRRLSFFILDRLLVRESNSHTKPTYEGIAGYMLDLKHAIAHPYFNYQIYHNNYIHSLSSLRDIVSEKNGKDFLIIDFGCGAGVLTRILKKIYKEAHVVGIDIRKETMVWNGILYPDITWGMVSDISTILANHVNRDKTVLISNGVLNFMQEGDIDKLLAEKIKYIVWFYYISFTNPASEYVKKEKVLAVNGDVVDYNLQLFSQNHHYDFTYKHLIKKGIHFIHGVSILKNN